MIDRPPGNCQTCRCILEITLEQIEEAANKVLDQRALLGRPLNKKERKKYVPILEMYESAAEGRKFRKRNPALQEHPTQILARLREVVEPPPPEDIPLEELSLADLEARILSILDVQETLKRPFMPAERKPWLRLLP